MSNGASARQDAARVLALAEDAGAGERLLEWSSALARALHRELSVVYLESTAALEAAALPAAQVLAHAGAGWSPLSRRDVELGFRAHAARLRASTERLALQQALVWSFRVMRGEHRDAFERLWAETNLLFLAAAAPPPAARAGQAQGTTARRRVVAAAGAPGTATARALQVGADLARALNASFTPLALDRDATQDAATLARLLQARPDLLVLPRDAASGLHALRRWPLLLVA